jgi:hypothetical protein
MIGHGRPASFALALARAALILCACLVNSGAAQNPPSAEPTQLRITWGGGDPVRWVGRIGVDEGALSNLKVLEAEPDAVGSIWLEEGQLHIRSLSAHRVDSIEVTSQVAPTAKLQIDLAAENSASPPRLEIPLADLPRRPYQVRLGDRGGNTLEVQILPPSPLRIVANRDPLIYAPGEQCSFEMSPVIPNLTPGTDLLIQTTMTPLSPGCRKEAPWSDNQRLAVPVDGRPKVVINVPLAKTEGVYSVHVSVSRPSGFDKLWTAPSRLATSTRLAERSFQVVVLDSRPPKTATAGRWESVLEIDPTNPRWIDKLPSWTQLRRIPGLNHGALGSTIAEVKDLPLGKFVELSQTPPTGDPHWQAYSLPLETVSVPHLLEIDYPADVEQHFGVSIVEPNANGFVSGANRDAGVYVEGLGRSEAKQKQTQRLVFWPRTQAPLLVVSNMHPNATAHFGQIRVFKRDSNLLSAGLPTNAISHDRLITAYLARPTVAETFGAARSIDSGVVNVAVDGVDEPETAYESATRLADYLRYSGYNSAIVSINSNGRTRTATPSPLDVDSTELMLRVFDREGIALLPALDFSAPLANLEALRRRGDAQVSGLEWVGRDGRTWLETNGTHRGRAPYYNLLDPRVQQAILENVRDTIERYGRHTAFAGLAVQLSSLGYAQLPTLEWGLDDTTFVRFARDKGIQLSNSGVDRFDARYKLLTGLQSVAWRSWRTKQVSDFYAQLALLVRGNSDRRLVLTTENVFADPHLAENMLPNLMARNAEDRLAMTLIDVGIDRDFLERLPGVVLGPTRYVEPMTSLPDRATDLELNEAFDLWRHPSTQERARAAVLYHRPIHQRLFSFEIAGRPWRVAGEMQLVCQPLPQGAAVRQPYVEALAEHDPAMIIDGGERLPFGEEDVLRNMRYMFSQLPTSAEVAEIDKQPIVVRTYTERDRTTVVAMNLSPWGCDANVTLDVPQETTFERLPLLASDATANKAARLMAGSQPWAAQLGPYEISVMRVSAAGVKVVDVQIAGKTANAELASKLADLNNRDLTAKRDYPVLSNPSFEPLAGAGRVAGWHLSPSSGQATIQLDATNPQDGRSCLYVRSGGELATVESDAFPVPPTGQLAMTVYARWQNLAPNTELRLVVESDFDGKLAYRRAAYVPTNQMQRADGQWGEALAIFASDLPIQMRGQMRIAFELAGAGEVWLDNVKLDNLLFPLRSYPNSKADCLQVSQKIVAAKRAFDAGQITDCTRIVNGYWPRFILEYCPPNQLNVAERIVPKNAPALPPQPDQGQDPSPGISDRLKRLVPFAR